MTTLTRDQQRVLVQTATQLGPDDNWTTQQFLTCDRWSYGQGQIIGNATLRQDYGLVYGPDPTVVRNLGIVPDLERSGLGSIAGNFVRICLEDSTGTITNEIPVSNSQGQITFETVRYVPVWYGIVHGPSISINGAVAASSGGLAVWECGGLAECLAQFDIVEGVTQGVTSPIDFNFLPAFNENGIANRSSAPTGINGRSVYIPQVWQTDPTQLWTARQILEFIIARYVIVPSTLHGSIFVGLNITLTGDLGALDYPPTDYDAFGKNIFDIVNDLVTGRGLTWWLEPDADGNVDLVVSSTQSTAFVSGSVTIPATSRFGSLTVAGNSWLSDVRVVTDDSGAKDYIAAFGDREIVAASFEWNPGSSSLYSQGMFKGWTEEQQSEWIGYSQEMATENVYRRFILKLSYDGTPLNNRIGLIHKIFSTLPQPANANDEGPDGDNQTDPREKAKVFLQNPGAGWEDVTELCRISVENDPPAILLDFNDGGVTLYNQITGGYGIRVTVGMQVNYLLNVSGDIRFLFPPATSARTGHRTKAVMTSAKRHSYTQGAAETGPFIGCVAGELVVGPDEIYLDETQKINDAFARNAAALSGFLYRATWTDRGRALTDFSGTAYAPGYLITITDVPSCKVVVTRRTVVRNGDHFDTEIEAETIPVISGARL